MGTMQRRGRHQGETIAVHPNGTGGIAISAIQIKAHAYECEDHNMYFPVEGPKAVIDRIPWRKRSKPNKEAALPWAIFAAGGPGVDYGSWRPSLRAVRAGGISPYAGTQFCSTQSDPERYGKR